MKKLVFLIVTLTVLLGCKKENPVQFSEAALNDPFLNLEGTEIIFKNILETHNGKTLVIDIWASWCGDCIKNLPKVKSLQNQYKEATYLFLSLDRSVEAWQKGIKKYDIKGQHYFMKSGWDGPFAEFVDLDWIPRYMVIDKEGHISLFDAVKADDKELIENINTNLKNNSLLE
ncbi:TlpA family protein disulfide reductase [Changchengzhania lutea]|uniref:TlpA family protein disulfide reductase n=1 Tax=Changchengzhania lutea TaxID=2049305 RepID=UPI00115C8803|nr:TlpA disulfide reductase family protein [Changchengzhania lutea]